jgi:hypothetical protein
MTDLDEHVRQVVDDEIRDVEGKRERLVTLIALVEDYLGLERSVPLAVRPRLAGQALSAADRPLWLSRRRAWLMELRAIESYHELPSMLCTDPRRVRRQLAADPRSVRPV